MRECPAETRLSEGLSCRGIRPRLDARTTAVRAGEMDHLRFVYAASPPSRFALRWTTSASTRWLANRSSARYLAERRLERETGFEPATSTLARSHSTTELFPLVTKTKRNTRDLGRSRRLGWGIGTREPVQSPASHLLYPKKFQGDVTRGQNRLAPPSSGFRGNRDL